MRIIGGHDYYDSALAYGQDADLVFVRAEKGFAPENTPLEASFLSKFVYKPGERYRYNPEDVKYKGDEYRFYAVSVYVAAKHYGGIKVVKNPCGVDALSDEIHYFWHYDAFEAFVQSMGYEVYIPKKDWEGNLHAPWSVWFEPRDTTEKEYEFIIKERIAVAVSCEMDTGRYIRLTPGPWSVNGSNLRSVNFQKALDPYTCFQEISMFVGGVLPRNPNPMVEITDPKIKIAKHGFDEWSFRKQKVAK